ncbi:AAA family ATPase (plasmid) [Lysinibacillus capsici]|uniref:AAA family ATPase n=2 Tax=Bacteria TaxID=2 RepID=A0A7T7WLB8_9GAMM|nr:MULTISPECIES: AAA family ATPase [Bacteria]AHE40527.1 ATP-binding protein p271 [Exiguobacterium sp. S3-2]QQN89780.1 AAA family ATPase [Acinetobacter variabilis]UYB50014.1 AAA family ATPase [Lysinibacillus capsici]
MNKGQKFIETKEYKRFAEFCDACIKYKYIGICYGLPGVGKTLSSRYFSNWDSIEKQIAYKTAKNIDLDVDEKILEARTIFYTAPAVRATKMTEQINLIESRMNMVRTMYKVLKKGEEENYTPNAYEDIDLIIVDEIDRLKVQNLEQLRDIYDRNDLAMILIGMPGIEKRLARYPQLYSRIGFAHEFDKLSKDETHHILEYKWEELGLSIKLEDFSDYEAITSIIKITGGNFRLIQRLFTQIERILEINKLETITTEVVEAARDSLVIGIK